MPRFTAVAVWLALVPAARAQHPLRHFADAVEVRFARSQPVLGYRLHVDSTDLSGFDVELTIRNAPDTFRLAMAAHPEYDDRYWRYLDGPRVESAGGTATVVREDSALWRVTAPGGAVVVRYRLRLPPVEGMGSAWKPFVAVTGALVGGPHAFLYMVGAELAPAYVALDLPTSWDVATGLEPTSDPRIFFAPSADVLMDSPVLAGRLRSWRFAVDGVPHRVAYWPLPQAAPFDTIAFVGDIERLVRQAVALFGRAPYREYTFLFVDGAYGALEHRNSVTLGAPSADLARRVTALLPETAHEYFHTWNLMRIRPAEYRDVDYRPQPPVAGLWFSEGLTMFYADLLSRRAGIHVSDSTRVAHLEYLIGNYLANPGNSHFSLEQISRVAYGAAPGALGDYSVGPHLPGELLGTMLDLAVRDATGSTRSMDDVMRAMLERYAGERGFTGADVERTIADVCRCGVAALFAAHVRTAHPIDFDHYLGLMGLHTRVEWLPAVRDSQAVADLRIRAWLPPGGRNLRLWVLDPGSVWGRAGLHTGDELVSVNGTGVPDWPAFRALLGRWRIGDTVQMAVLRPTGPARASVVVTGYDRPVVHIEENQQTTPRQRKLREAWSAGH
jgi:predicted metalloprotease with PDZ domain